MMPADIVDAVQMSKKTTRGERLREALDLRGYGMNELNRIAKRRDGSGLSTGYVSRFASDAWDNPGVEEIAALADALGISLAWLAWGEGSMTAGEMAKGKSKPVLESVIVALNSKGRWSPPTVAAARAMPSDCEPESWPALLDRIEKELKPVIAKIEKESK